MINFLFKKAKQLAGRILNYGIYVIYQYQGVQGAGNSSLDDYEFREVKPEALESSLIETIKEQAWYGGDGSQLFACILDEQIVSVCAYWYGERYLQRNFWPLKKNEAKLVQLFTAPEARGKGIAQKLIQYSSQKMVEKGFKGLYARVWHSNYPSRKAFQNSQWDTIATVIELHPVKKLKPIRLRVGKSTRKPK